MNILISTLDRKSFYFRSDSTMIRKLDCYYIPDYVSKITAVPILCFRLDRAGKCIPQKFAARFIGPAVCGIMLRCELKDSGIPHREFIVNNLDYTTIIPYDLLPISELGTLISEVQPFTVRTNGILRQQITEVPTLEEVTEIFSSISRYCSVRTGDFMAIELTDGFEVKAESHLVAEFHTGGNIDFLVK